METAYLSAFSMAVVPLAESGLLLSTMPGPCSRRFSGRCSKGQGALEKHSSCTAQDYYGRTPLHSVVLHAHEKVIKELFDYGVDTSTTDFKGRTALHVGAQGYSPGVLRLLLEKGADIAARDGESMTTLHFAHQKGVERTVDCLIEKGANTEAESIYGLTPEMLYSLRAYSQQ